MTQQERGDSNFHCYIQDGKKQNQDRDKENFFREEGHVREKKKGYYEEGTGTLCHV